MNALVQFDQRHSVQGPPLHNGYGHWVFPDGARRENNILGAFLEPPSDEWERQKNVVKWHELYVKQAIDHFKRVKHLLDERLLAAEKSRAMVPDEEELDGLRAAKRVVAERRKQLAAAQELCEKLRPERLKQNEKRAEEAAAQRVAELASFKRQLNRIRI